MTSPSSDGPTAPMAPVGEQPSMLDDFMEIFYAPSAVFGRREKSGYGLLLLIITVASALLMFVNRGVFSQIMDAELQRAAAKAVAGNPSIPMDQMQSMLAIQGKVITAFSYIGTLIAAFVLGFLLWLAAKIGSAKLSYQQTVLIVTLAWIPQLVSGLITTVQVLVMDTSAVTSQFALSLSVARFMDLEAGNQKLIAFAGRLDVFAIWYAVLLAIGVSVMAKVSPARGYVISGVLFVLGSLPALMR